jgi:hypothetical protein
MPGGPSYFSQKAREGYMDMCIARVHLEGQKRIVALLELAAWCGS